MARPLQRQGIDRVVVTGSTGMAAAVARRLASRQRRVFVLAQDAASARRLAEDLAAVGAGWHAVDLRDERDTEVAFAAAEQHLGGIDGVVAVAGGSARSAGDGWLHEMSLAAWQSALELNLTTTFLTAREAVRRLRDGGGSLLLTSSVLATAPQPAHFATHGYAAAKAAIDGWVTALAAAYAPQGIRVNAVAPGLVRTPMARRAAESPEILAFAGRKQPLVRGMLEAEQVAETMCSLLLADGVTGQVVRVDGGWAVTSTS